MNPNRSTANAKVLANNPANRLDDQKPDEFERLIPLSETGDKLLLKFDRNEDDDISGITSIYPAGFTKYRKVD